jgi:DNA helicase-2/ATP-dependent DNA helicase PcrA
MFDPDIINGAFAQTPRKKDFLDGLNEKQRIAAETTEGPLVIMAGAGTGKTTVLTNRMAHIIESRLAQPSEILSVTFTRKAAGEMKARLSKMLGDHRGRNIRVGNFHSVSSEILRRHASVVDLPKNFNVLDEDGQRDVIATAAIEKGFIKNKKDRHSIMNILSQIASWKEEGYDVEFIQTQEFLGPVSQGPMANEEEFLGQCAQVFEIYQEELRLRRWCDFADLILHVVRIFRKYPDIRAREAALYRYILVDEFQDTSPVQNEWVTLMAQDHQNICVVGDTDQSIYEWRNARPDIMMNFHQNWKDCKQVTIDTNYRSSQQILNVANIVVEPLRQKDGLDKQLTSPRTGPEPVDFFETFKHGMDEANSISHRIEEMIIDGVKPSEIAILCRSGMIIKSFERALRDQQIRYTVAGAMKFTDREEVKDAISYLTLATNPMDYVAFERISKKPSRGIGPQKVAEIRKVMMQKRCSVKAAVDEITMGLNPRTAAAKALLLFSNDLSSIDSAANNSITAGQALEDILELTGYLDWRRKADKDPQKEFRLENLEQIISEACAYDSPRDFLEAMSLQSGGDAQMFDDSIVISTVHASKGLEFDIVFTPAMEDGIFPNSRSEQTTYGPDEERRLAHVAWTRARKELRISWARSRMGRTDDGHPSPYLFEIGMPVTDLMSSMLPVRPKSAPGTPRKLRRRTF